MKTTDVDVAKLTARREEILRQMREVAAMEYGSISADYWSGQRRTPVRRSGPYFKYQVWANGRNQSRRISADEAAVLKPAVMGRKQFEQLSREFIEVTVALTRAERETESEGLAESMAAAPL